LTSTAAGGCEELKDTSTWAGSRLHGPPVDPQGTRVAEKEAPAGAVVEVVVEGMVVVDPVVVVVVDGAVVDVVVDPGKGTATESDGRRGDGPGDCDEPPEGAHQRVAVELIIAALTIIR
jgi:hypothetical protein